MPLAKDRRCALATGVYSEATCGEERFRQHKLNKGVMALSHLFRDYHFVLLPEDWPNQLLQHLYGDIESVAAALLHAQDKLHIEARSWRKGLRWRDCSYDHTCIKPATICLSRW